MTRIPSIFLLFALAACAVSPSGPDDRPVSTPYTGDLAAFEYAGRAENLQIERVMDLLGLAPGRSVADIGAGSGWFAVRAARRVAPGGTVYAIDINPPYVTHLAERAAREGLANLLAGLGSGDDANLPRASVDAVLFLNAYHEVARPVDLLRNLQPALRPGARVGVIDKRGHGNDHGVSPDIITAEATRAGYRLIDEQDFVKGDGMDYFLIFQSTR